MRLWLSESKMKMSSRRRPGSIPIISPLYKWIPAFAGMTMLLFSPPALAEEYTYSPEGCEFVITFPEEPRATQRCHDIIQDRCTLMASYTQVFEMDATLNFYVNCEPTERNMREDYTPDALRTMLLARPGVDNLEVYDVTYSETDNATTAALLGAGPSPGGQDPMVYVIQLWVGESSIFTLEAELIGKGHDEADTQFADILRSLHHKDWQPETAEEPEEPAEPAESAESEAPETGNPSD